MASNSTIQYAESSAATTTRRNGNGNVAWRPLLPVLIVLALMVYEEQVSFPSCKVLPGIDSEEFGEMETGDDSPEDLRVMMVANLLLLGSEAGLLNRYFRDYYMAKFFRKSFDSLNPDMLLVLGDLSAKGSELTRSEWLAVFHQFHQVLGPFLDLPFHVVLGDRDVGECHNLDAKSVKWISRNLPGLDSAGCGAFEISNISFVSLNSVGLVCGNKKLRFGVEKVLERESVDLQRVITEGTVVDESANHYGWRENSLAARSGPVLLLHLPLHQKENNYYKEIKTLKRKVDATEHDPDILESRGYAAAGLHGLYHTVPPNATEYIFQALKPRMIFSGHTHEFGVYTHSDGTREIKVPAMSWIARNDPGFIVATFRGTKRPVSISYCSIAKESHILIAYASVLVLLLFLTFVKTTQQTKWLRQ